VATYKQIQEWVKKKYGFTPKTCWIADVKEQCGLKVRKTWNRQGKQRLVPCPQDKIKPIKKALHHFKML